MIEAIKTQQQQIASLKLALLVTFVLALAALAPTIYLIGLQRGKNQ